MAKWKIVLFLFVSFRLRVCSPLSDVCGIVWRSYQFVVILKTFLLNHTQTHLCGFRQTEVSCGCLAIHRVGFDIIKATANGTIIAQMTLFCRPRSPLACFRWSLALCVQVFFFLVNSRLLRYPVGCIVSQTFFFNIGKLYFNLYLLFDIRSILKCMFFFWKITRQLKNSKEIFF